MMTGAQLQPWIESFMATIGARLGLRVESRIAFDVVQRRAAARGLSEAAYLAQFDDPSELRALALELTVGESYFFRHREQLDAFVEVAVPARLAAQAEVRQLAILSAGCSTGEEPYTLAMLTRDHVPADWQVAIHGVDINSRAIARAQRGHYSRWSMRALPAASERRWFTREPSGGAVIDPELRAAVVLGEGNLAADSPVWARTWDLVFCRNVLMYFTEAQADALIARIVGALAPGGFLFLGHAEIVWSRGAVHGGRGEQAARALAELETCNSHGTFYYRRRTGPRELAVKSTGPIAIPPAARALAPSAPVTADEARIALAAAVPSSDDAERQLWRALLQLANSGGGA
jgi:chemotaxis protein methyltransferase CheR